VQDGVVPVPSHRAYSALARDWASLFCGAAKAYARAAEMNTIFFMFVFVEILIKVFVI